MHFLTAQSGSFAPLTQRPKTRSALLVDPDPYLTEVRRFLLDVFFSSVATASSPQDVFCLRLRIEPHVTVLSDALGFHQLREAAEDVRHLWPRSRILIIGRAASALEDPDYDETITAECSPTEFLLAISQCIAFHCAPHPIAIDV